MIWLRVREDPNMKSAIGLIALFVVIAFGLVALNDIGEINFTFIGAHWQFLLEPAGTALFVTVIAYIIGFCLAIPLGMVRAFGPTWMRQKGLRSILIRPAYGIVTGYTEAIRGTPVFVQILIIQGIVTSALAKVPSIAVWSGIIALTINTTGYQTEVFRAGFQSVGQGQVEAARSIGMSPVQTFASVTLPQGLRLIVLPLANEWIGLFKASSLLWYIAVQELMWGMEYLGTTLNHPVDAFLMGSLFYLGIIIPLSRAITFIEARKRIPGLGTGENLNKRFITMRAIQRSRT